MIELPPKFHNQAPINPDADPTGISADMPWKGTAGLANDIRYYGAWMREKHISASDISTQKHNCQMGVPPP